MKTKANTLIYQKALTARDRLIIINLAVNPPSLPNFPFSSSPRRM
jgi:hypothetical protein